MKISVITACHNSAATLERALVSVGKQNHASIEHIVIDGGSTDGTAAILSRHRSNLSQVVSEPDRGIYDAMNKGLEHASGDIICFLNADDYYAAGNVLSEVAQLMQARGLDALMGDVEFFAEANPNRIVRRYRSDRFSPAKLAWGWMPAHPALFFIVRSLTALDISRSTTKSRATMNTWSGHSTATTSGIIISPNRWSACKPAAPAPAGGGQLSCLIKKSCVPVVKTVSAQMC